MLTQLTSAIPEPSVAIEHLGLPFADALAWCSAAGAHAVQLSATMPQTRVRTMDRSERRGIGDAVRASNAAATGIDCILPPEHLADPARADTAAQALLAAIEWAELLGRLTVTTWLPASDGHATALAVRSAVIAEAQRRGVTLAVLGGGHDTDGPAAIAIDPPVLLAAGESVDAACARAGSRLAGLRLVDLLRSGHRGPVLQPGDARLDALALAATLATIGFRAHPVIDARGWADAPTGIRSTLDRWLDRPVAARGAAHA